MKKILLLILILSLSMTSMLFAGGGSEDAQDKHMEDDKYMDDDDHMYKDSRAKVVEIVTFKLKPGVTIEEFNKLDKAVENQHVIKQPGFVSREAGATENGEWVAIIHWESVEDADASMQSFADAPATADFMAKMNPETMQLQRYIIQR